MEDSLYGNLLAGPPNRPPADQAEDVDDEPVPVKKSGEKAADSIFAADDLFAPAPPAKAGAAASPPAEPEKKDEPAAGPTPAPAPQTTSTFSAAKLMMPPVRKKAEPNAAGKALPKFDIAKLQEEKEALMRQRAAADTASKADKARSSFVRAAGASSAVDDAIATSSAGAASSTAKLSESLYGSPDEEYDPAKPNDYDEFCRRRMRLKAEEELEKRRQEALARHQKGLKEAEPKEDDFATKMLKKMGWKEGSGLGKDGQGMATPLVLKKTDAKQGTIVEGQKREATPAQPQGQPEAKQAKVAQRPPSCVLLLNNMVGAGEVDEDLEEETGEEAGKYGKLVKCKIKEIKGLPDDQAVRIFLEFTLIEEATKALLDMNGRYFGGRVVKARFFDPARFAAGDLDKKPDE